MHSPKITANVGMTQLGKLATVGAMLVLLELANLLEQLLGLLLLLSGHTSILSKEKSCTEKTEMIACREIPAGIFNKQSKMQNHPLHTFTSSFPPNRR